MNQQQIYEAFKPTVMGQVLNIDGVDPGQCTQVVLKYGEVLFPGIPYNTVFPPTPSAKDFFANHNPVYFDAIANDHTSTAQLPEEGDVMVFNATPCTGFTNQFNNQYGHVGVCDSASASDYSLLQQNAPTTGSPVNVTSYPWTFRPCIGWLRPKLVSPALEDATAYKEGVVSSKAWSTDMKEEVTLITTVINDLWQFKQDALASQAMESTAQQKLDTIKGIVNQ